MKRDRAPRIYVVIVGREEGKDEYPQLRIIADDHLKPRINSDCIVIYCNNEFSPPHYEAVSFKKATCRFDIELAGHGKSDNNVRPREYSLSPLKNTFLTIFWVVSSECEPCRSFVSTSALTSGIKNITCNELSTYRKKVKINSDHQPFSH
jgi:hypothetical protein